LKSPAMPDGTTPHVRGGVGRSPDPCMDLVHQHQFQGRGGRDGPTLLITVMIGIDGACILRTRFSVCGSRPSGVDEHHRGIDGVVRHPVGSRRSRRGPGSVEQLMTQVRYGKRQHRRCSIEMPLAFSISIQSDTVARRPVCRRTAPSSVNGPGVQASASVNDGFAGVGMADDGEGSAATRLRGKIRPSGEAGVGGFGGKRPGALVGNSASDVLALSTNQ